MTSQRLPDFCLTFPDKDTADAALFDVDGIVTIDPVFGNGIVYHPTGEVTTGSDGIETPVMAQSAGYHVNVQVQVGASLPASLEQYKVTPLQPKQVFY